MKNQAANISVIIPAYNRAGLIGETLRSLLNQTVPAKEIIVVDDGSTDGTAEVVERIAEEIEVRRSEIGKERGAGSREQGGEEWNVELSLNNPLSAIRYQSSNTAKPRIRVIRQSNAGPGAARNRGLREANGEFIHFFDSDDIAAPNKQEVQLRALVETGADIAYGAWVKGRFLPSEKLKHGKAETLKTELTTNHTNKHERGEAGPCLDKSSGAAFSNPSTSEIARHSENPSLIRSADGPAEGLDAGRWTLDAGPWKFVPEGPVLQGLGLPKGDLVKALLTNWSIVPHACLFRRSIVDKAGGFPEDLFGTEDQLMFLRCLLAGAKVVHSPGTCEFYRVGDPGKITATGSPQSRHAREWGRFLIKANQEVARCALRMASSGKRFPAEARRRGGFFGGWGSRGLWRTEVVSYGCTASTEGAQGDAPETCAGASEQGSLTSKLSDSPFSESPTRFASAPALSPATSYPLPVTYRHSAWFGFRLRAYEAWSDLGRFFPDGENYLKTELKLIWKRSALSVLGYRFVGFVIRKLGGLKHRLVGHRWSHSYCCADFFSFMAKCGFGVENEVVNR